MNEQWNKDYNTKYRELIKEGDDTPPLKVSVAKIRDAHNEAVKYAREQEVERRSL